MAEDKRKTEFGDFQTPLSLAERCCEVIKTSCGSPNVVIEPTCGKGSFLLAAARTFPQASLLGFEVNSRHAAFARRQLASSANKDWRVRTCDFFSTDWQRERAKHNGGEVLYLGNPPWVTNSTLGAINSQNLPTKKNTSGVRGIDAMTGRSNFDISESILQTLLDLMVPDRDVMAMLIKRATARKLMQRVWASGTHFSHLSLHPIDAKEEFGASVDACLFMAKRTNKTTTKQVCKEAISLGKPARKNALGWFDKKIVPDPVAAKSTYQLCGDSPTVWRSGVKHDLSRVMELVQEGKTLRDQSGTAVDVEPDRVFPLAKGADIANGRVECLSRRVLITQRSMDEDTRDIANDLPKTWRYLQKNSKAFASRKSSIYKNRDPFALFGIGDYTFAKWKVAICGLYKRLTFSVVGPVHGKPVILDDTCYFLSMKTQRQAKLVASLLDSDLAAKYFNARIFWDAKRPITASTLRSLDLKRLADAEGKTAEYQKCFAPATSRKRQHQTT